MGSRANRIYASNYHPLADSVPWTGVTSKPTTLAGYGIADFISSNASSPVAADATTTNGSYYVNSNISPLLGQADG
jgi:hypothetical protein